MPENVKISLSHLTDGQIVWPRRCPRCGSLGPLRNVKARVGVVHYHEGIILDLVESALKAKTQATIINFPVCFRHAFSNGVGVFILEKSTVPRFLRSAIYLVFILHLMAAFNFMRGDRSILIRIADDPVGYSLFAAFGIMGVAAILWARRASSVWPTTMDRKTNIVSILFSDQAYAMDFKKANPKATSKAYVKERSFVIQVLTSENFWLWVIVIGVFVLILRE